MIRLPLSLKAWETAGFEDVFKQETGQLDAARLPLQQGLSVSSQVTDRPFQTMVIRADADAAALHVKAGIFYTGVIAGCSCADDPTPIDEQTEYCVVRFDIDRTTAEATATLLAE